MRSVSKDLPYEKLTDDEKGLFSLYQEEFIEIFQNILLDSSGKFISNLFRRLRLTLSLKLNDYPKETIIRVEKFIIETYYPFQYKISYNAMKQVTRKNAEDISVSIITCFRGQFTKHCKNSNNNTTDVLHSCGKKLLQFTYKDFRFDEKNKSDSLFICLECEQIYKSNFVKLLCVQCDCEYYSKIETKEDEGMNSLYPATWVKYHCNAIINDKMKCLKCKDVLYLNRQNNKQLICLKCNKIMEVNTIKWVCVLCTEEFQSEAKEYNPLDFKIMKMAVKDALIEKIKVRPEGFQCDKPECHTDAKGVKFFHKKQCKGELYLGVMNKKKILVCSLCHSLNYYESFIWTCPICEEKVDRMPREHYAQNIVEYIRYNSSKKNNNNHNNHIRRRESLDNKKIKLPTPVKIPFDKSNNISALVKKINDNKMNRDRDREKENKQPNVVRKFNFDDEIVNQPSSNKNSSKSITEANQSSNNSDDVKYIYERFNSDDFDIKSKIGEGTFGKIYLVESKAKNKYAMKKIVGNSITELESLRHEYDILHTLSYHTEINIISIYGLQTKRLDRTTYVMYVLMELAQSDWEKEILSRSKVKKYYTEAELWITLNSLIHTFSKLQSEHVSHRDIKPQNILLCSNGQVKVADFGEAKQMMFNKRITDKQTIRGTELFMSPILFNALRYRRNHSFSVEHNTYKSDVYSLGLCFLFAASLTFSSLYDIRELTEMPQVSNAINKYLKGKYTTEFIDIITDMLEIEERTRYDFIELKKRIKEYSKDKGS